MARHSKPRHKLGSKAAATAKGADAAAEEEPKDPLRAYPANPPRRNLAMLVVAVGLFAAWFCYLAYLALSTN